jgi:hypothetical protein
VPASDLIQRLQNRHRPCCFDLHPSQVISTVWEETWSSDRPGTRDHSGEIMIKQLGQLLRDSNQRFEDPFFPADSSSLFVDPTHVEKNRFAQKTGRSDEDPFLAGRDVQRDVSWKRVAEIGNPREIPVVPTADIFLQSDVLLIPCVGQVFSGSVSPEDVKQGALGNCCKSHCALIARTILAQRSICSHPTAQTYAPSKCRTSRLANGSN